MFKKILVPLDGSDLSLNILPYVGLLASEIGSHVVLLTVVDPDSLQLPQSLLKDEKAGDRAGKHLHDRVRADAQGKLEALARQMGQGRNIHVSVVVASGNPADQVVTVAVKERCDLIAMATHGRNVFGRSVLGSVTDKVLHSSTIPTLTLRPSDLEGKPRQWQRISTIIVPLDGSPLAESALPYAKHLAIKLGIPLLLARVVSLGTYPYADSYYGAVAELQTELEDDARNYLDQVAKRLELEGANVPTRVMVGYPASSIADLAQETPDSLVAMATHGRSGITRWLMGSVAESIVRSSGEPVLIIPPAEVIEDQQPAPGLEARARTAN